jgi:hypothetical protein
MDILIDKNVSMETLSEALKKESIDNTLKAGNIELYYHGEHLEIVKSEEQLTICKPASGIACIILAAIPAAICSVFFRYSFELSGLWLSLSAFIPFVIFRIIFQSAMTKYDNEAIRLLAEKIQYILQHQVATYSSDKNDENNENDLFLEQMRDLSDDDLMDIIDNRSDYDSKAIEAMKIVGIERRLIDEKWEKL